MPILHAKECNIPDWTQEDLDAEIALGNYPPDTTLDDIIQPSDHNEPHTNPDIEDVNGLVDALNDKQDLLESGTNIKTINGSSILGGGNLSIETGSVPGIDDIFGLTDAMNANQGVTIAALSTSANGFTQSPYSYLITKHADRVRRLVNGGKSGGQAKAIAETFYTNIVPQKPSILLLGIASNDYLGGSISDTPVPGSGSIANAKYYTTWVIERALALGMKVALVSEPYRQAPQTGANTNPLYWNNTYLPGLVASYNNRNLIYIDMERAVCNTETGEPLIPIISQTATGSAGASSFTVPDATGITRGMYCHDNNSKLGTSTLTKRVTDISGTGPYTITFTGTIASGGINQTVYFYVDYYDNVHPSPVGADKKSDPLFEDLDAAGWLPYYKNMSPIASTTPATTIDNLHFNGTCEDVTVTAGVANGWATNFSGTKAVETRAGFIGKVQKVSLVAGESAGKYCLPPSADVKRLRNRWVYGGISGEFVGFQPNGAIISALCTFNVTPPALPGTFTVEGAQPFYWDNISIVDGKYYFHFYTRVPQNASTLSWNFTNNLVFPAGAATDGVIYLGELFLYDASPPFEAAGFNESGVVVASFSTSGYTISPYDKYVALDASTSGAVTKALPAASTWKSDEITIGKADTVAGNTITLTGAVTGDVVLGAQGENATFWRAGSLIYKKNNV